MKKILSLITAMILSLNLFSVTTLAKTKFKDVSPNDWFYENVNTAVELGLMVGVSDNEFAPKDKVTIGMAITLASRIHSIYMNDGEEFKKTEGRWVKPYIDYAIEKGIIDKELYEGLTEIELYDEIGNQTACRGDIARIFSQSLPSEALEEINTVEYGAIPDVMYDIIDFDDEHKDMGVYTLYRAGVFVGSDEKGTFHPFEPITRAEIAAIASRMLKKNLRQKVNLKSETYEKLKRKEVKGYASEKELVNDFLSCMKNKEISQKFIDSFDHIAYSAYIMEHDIPGIRWQKAYEALLNFDKGAEYIQSNFPEIVELYEKEKEKPFNDDVLSYYLFGVQLSTDIAVDMNMNINDRYNMDIYKIISTYLEWMAKKIELYDLQFNKNNIRRNTDPSEYYYAAGGFDESEDYWMELGIDYFIYNGEYRWFWPTMVLMNR